MAYGDYADTVLLFDSLHKPILPVFLPIVTKRMVARSERRWKFVPAVGRGAAAVVNAKADGGWT